MNKQKANKQKGKQKGNVQTKRQCDIFKNLIKITKQFFTILNEKYSGRL